MGGYQEKYNKPSKAVMGENHADAIINFLQIHSLLFLNKMREDNFVNGNF